MLTQHSERALRPDGCCYPSATPGDSHLRACARSDEIRGAWVARTLPSPIPRAWHRAGSRDQSQAIAKRPRLANTPSAERGSTARRDPGPCGTIAIGTGLPWGVSPRTAPSGPRCAVSTRESQQLGKKKKKTAGAQPCSIGTLQGPRRPGGCRAVNHTNHSGSEADQLPSASLPASFAGRTAKSFARPPPGGSPSACRKIQCPVKRGRDYAGNARCRSQAGACPVVSEAGESHERPQRRAVALCCSATQSLGCVNGWR